MYYTHAHHTRRARALAHAQSHTKRRAGDRVETFPKTLRVLYLVKWDIIVYKYVGGSASFHASPVRHACSISSVFTLFFELSVFPATLEQSASLFLSRRSKILSAVFTVRRKKKKRKKRRNKQTNEMKRKIPT